MKFKLLRKMQLRQATKKMVSCFIAVLVFCSFSLAQNVSVTGKVTDENGQPLIGVVVMVVGTTSGATTDIDGNYKVSAPSAESQLQYSFLGYITETVTVGAQTVIDIQLEPEAQELDEVVIIGYGVQKKKLNTGATLNLGGDDIQQLNTTGTMDALKGLSPGVTITQNNGVPGSGNKIFIRGIGTIGDYDPLYIVDGVSVNNIDNLSPSDIESIDVLKDAASAAIYGSRAANGVILVTTKQGKINTAPVVEYAGYYGIQNVAKGPELCNAQQYTELVTESINNAGHNLPSFVTDVPDWENIENGTNPGTNWFELMQDKNAPVQSHAINITGGSETSSYSLGASYLDQQGILGKQVNNDYKRINLRLNSNHVLFKTAGRNLLSFGQTFTYTNTKNPAMQTGGIYANDLHNVLVASPYLPMWADTVTDLAYPYHYAINYNLTESNPIASMALNAEHNTNNNNTIIGSAYLELQPIKNLKIKSNFGINNYYGSSRLWRPAYEYSSVSKNDKDYVRQSMYSGYSWTSTNTATYSLSIANSHNFTFLVGQEAQRNAANLDMTGDGDSTKFIDPEYAYLDNLYPLDAQTVTNCHINGKDVYGWAMLSYFTRLSYDYKEKYMATVVMRWDASSRFAKGNRWGRFPSVSAGWVISNEEFMQNTSAWLNFMKLRASWGRNGNQEITDFVYLARITDLGTNYFFGTDPTIRSIGASPSEIANPDIKWETSEQTDIGLDVNFLNSRLQLAIDWYRKDTKDWLVRKISSVMDGTGAPYVNGGLIRNTGIETMLSWNDNLGDFKYGVTGTFAYNKNEVLEVPSQDSIFHGPINVLAQGQNVELYRAQTGYPIGYFWGFETDGVFQSDEEAALWVQPATGENPGAWYFSKYDDDGVEIPDQYAGDLKYVDKDGDGSIDADDKVMIGNPHPDVTVGLQLSADYKGLYLIVTGNGAFGMQVAKNYRSPDNYRHNYTMDDYNKRWHGAGTSNKYPRLYDGSHRNQIFISDIYMYNADFFRIGNVTLGYDFNKLFKNMPFQSTKIYIAAKNLHTFTKYPGMDPEVGANGGTSTVNSWAAGIDLGTYPLSRTYLVGANITF